ncbi:MAG: uracil-DNA glycosylase [Candidatus Marinimicrobia bacterium]|nr:uracil-DNA glycosylase [Candidatus Neomarinimicrobiota bacterium]
MEKENILEDLYSRIGDCTSCALAEKCNQKVPGHGKTDTRLMLIGEAPGREEDKQGLPFVGKSGKLLDKILAAIELKREQIYISNIVKCRPPENRNPRQEEIQKCIGFLQEEIEVVDPDIIVALGLTASRNLLNSDSSLKQLRQEDHTYQGKILIPTYHPSALLQNPSYKRPTWEDFKKVKKLYFGE